MHTTTSNTTSIILIFFPLQCNNSISVLENQIAKLTAMGCPVGAIEGQEELKNLQIEIEQRNNKLKSETPEEERLQKQNH